MVTAEKLVRMLAEKRLTCATAESCTGGGVGAAITAVAGASEVFWGGVISYDNSVKRDVLGVDGALLENKGAVSAECAAEMAQGVRRLLKTDLAVSVTGIAGPGGGTREKPVGLVWFATASAERVHTESRIFPGSRDEVRKAAALHALELLMAAASFCEVKASLPLAAGNVADGL